MDDEFDRLMKYFEGEAEIRDKNIEDIFQKSMDFFEKYKHVLSGNDEEEKAHVKKKMEILRSRLKEENERTQQKLNMTPEQIKQISNDPKYFSPKQWEFLVGAQKEIQLEKERHEDELKRKKIERQRAMRGKKSGGKLRAKRSDWMKS